MPPPTYTIPTMPVTSLPAGASTQQQSVLKNIQNTNTTQAALINASGSQQKAGSQKRRGRRRYKKGGAATQNNNGIVIPNPVPSYKEAAAGSNTIDAINKSLTTNLTSAQSLGASDKGALMKGGSSGFFSSLFSRRGCSCTKKRRRTGKKRKTRTSGKKAKTK